MTPFHLADLAAAPSFGVPMLLAQATPAPAPDTVPPPAGGSGYIVGLMYLMMFGGVYFLIIAPQRKRQKEQAKMIEAMKVGDEVITTGGILGTVTQIKSDRCIVEIAKGVRVEVRKTNVEVLPPPAVEKVAS
jgi:preprotein translocase subunit YajC